MSLEPQGQMGPLCQGIQQEERETTVARGRMALCESDRRGLSCALAGCLVALPTDSHSWAFDGSVSI